MAEEKKLIGKVTHYFTNIGVAVIELEDTLKVGDEISIEGATTNFTQKIESMQIEHESVKEAKKGDSIGLKVSDRVREGDQVFKV
jgi:translation elongation factor EF-1alpha